ncbi:hypothetical protein QZH41_005473 [Actinostola sp. cb2023]|nr:hypothetical protein QZH41_005473 [Actinostola sp. cb2023]
MMPITDPLMTSALIKATPSPNEVQDILSNLAQESSRPRDGAKMAGDIKMSTLILTEVVQYNNKLSNDVENNTRNIQSTDKPPACVFWDFELNSHGGGWSRDGCRLTSQDGSRVTCQCDHLTNFAVLMSTYDLKIACTAVAAMLHYFFLSAVAWMLVEGIQIYVAIVMVFQIERNRKYFYLIGWDIFEKHIGRYDVTWFAKRNNSNRGNFVMFFSCWLSAAKGLVYAFIGPVLAVVLINIVIFIMVIRAMMTTQKMVSANEKQKARLAAKCCAVLLPLLGLTWLFGILAVDHNVVIFLYLFAIFNSLQNARKI